jgi:ArsR family transcriptional regulator
MTADDPSTACGVATSADALGLLGDEEFARVAHALAHPTRLSIVRRLTACNECVAAEIFEEIDLAQSTVSEHLRVLREAGVVRSTIQGNRTYYCANRATLAQFESTLAGIADART